MLMGDLQRKRNVECCYACIIDVISGQRKKGKIYDFMKLMLASDLAENSSKNKRQQ